MKRALVEADERQTLLVMRTLRNTARVYKNGVAEAVRAIEAKGGATIEDLAPYVSGTKGRVLIETGEMEAGVLSAGMVTGLIHDIPTVQELVQRIVTEAREIVRTRFSTLQGET